MKRLTLIKLCNDPKLAHLYEHIYCYEIEHILGTHGLLSYLDYHYDARTYQGGFIHIPMFLFTKEADKMYDLLRDVNPEFDVGSVADAMAEIAAEQQIRIVADIDKVQAALRELHSEPWQDIETIANIDISSIRRTSQLLEYTYDAPVRDFKTLTVNIALRQNDLIDSSVSYPLFYILAESLSNNLTQLLARKFGYYGSESVFNYNNKGIKHVRKYKVLASRTSKLTTEQSDCRNWILEMLKAGYVRKVADYLQDASYEISLRAPNELAFYEVSDMMVGAQGWRDLGDEEKVRNILRHMQISLSTRNLVHTIGVEDLVG
jgi:hypothetical protein